MVEQPLFASFSAACASISFELVGKTISQGTSKISSESLYLAVVDATMYLPIRAPHSALIVEIWANLAENKPPSS